MKIPIVIIFILVCAVSVSAQTTLSLTTGDDQNHERAKVTNAVLEECFRRMDITLKIIPMPSKRSLINANNGIEDGNFLRTDIITATYPNLIMVPEKLAENIIVAFSKRSDIRIEGWKSLLIYHVAYVNGWRNCERELADAKMKTVVKNEELLFTLLEKNRVEVAIFGKSTGKSMLRQLGYTDINMLEPPIVISDLFLYVHKKHEKLIPEIVKTLRMMKEDGTYDKLTEKIPQ